MNLGGLAGVISDAQNYDLFTELLKEIAGMWNIRITANGLINPPHACPNPRSKPIDYDSTVSSTIEHM